MATGQFREDLYFRLSVFPIHIPPLRERREDIPALAEHFLMQPRLPDVADAHLSKDVLEELQSRPWVGNVRELRNAIEHAAIVARGRPIRAEHLPPAATGTASGGNAGHSRNQGADCPMDRRRRCEPAAPSPSSPRSTSGSSSWSSRRCLRAVLEQCRGNRAAAAQMLGIHRATLRQKLRKYGIE